MPCLRASPPRTQDALGVLDSSQRSRLQALLEGVGLMVTEKPASPLFSTKHLEADLAKIVKVRRARTWRSWCALGTKCPAVLHSNPPPLRRRPWCGTATGQARRAGASRQRTHACCAAFKVACSSAYGHC